MGTVNNFVNSARDWNQKIHPETQKAQGLIKRTLAPRIAMAGTAVVDLGAAIGNTARAVLHVPSIIVRAVITPVGYISGSPSIKKIAANRSTVSDLIRTIGLVFKHILGAAVASTIGILSPRAGVKFHDFLKLSQDKRAAEVLAATKKCCVEVKQETTVVVTPVATSKVEDKVEEEVAPIVNAATQEAQQLAAEIKATQEEAQDLLNTLKAATQEAQNVEQEVKASSTEAQNVEQEVKASSTEAEIVSQKSSEESEIEEFFAANSKENTEETSEEVPVTKTWKETGAEALDKTINLLAKGNDWTTSNRFFKAAKLGLE